MMFGPTENGKKQFHGTEINELLAKTILRRAQK